MLKLDPNAWSWILFGVSAFGVWLTGTNLKVGWMFAIANQPLYITVAVLTHQYGNIATSCVFAAIYARNLRRNFWPTKPKFTVVTLPQPKPVEEMAA